MKIPQAIFDREDEIAKLVEENPIYIPLPTLASFLGANADGLRRSIENGQCPFGIMWQKTLHGNKAFKVPTYTFFKWYTINGFLQENPKNKEWLNLKESAEYLNIGYIQMQEMARQKGFPAHRLSSKTIRVNVKELDEWVKSKKCYTWN